jgi:hypothetical protein
MPNVKAVSLKRRAMKKLTKRFEMRCTPSDFRRWEKHAQTLGLPSVATFLRIAANEASRAPKVSAP